MQMFLAAMLVNAGHAALENREISLGAIDADDDVGLAVTVGPFFTRVNDLPSADAAAAAEDRAEARDAQGRSAATAARARAPAAYRSHLRRLGERDFIRPSVHQALALCALHDLSSATRTASSAGSVT